MLRKVAEDEDGRQAEHHLVVFEETEGADRVGAPPRKGAAMLEAERFGQDEDAIHSIEQAEAAGDPEGQARIDAAEDSAERRAEHEAHAERRAEQAKGSRTLFGRRNVGHVRHSGWDAGGGDSGDDAAEEEPAQRGRPGHQKIVESQAEV